MYDWLFIFSRNGLLSCLNRRVKGTFFWLNYFISYSLMTISALEKTVSYMLSHVRNCCIPSSFLLNHLTSYDLQISKSHTKRERKGWPKTALSSSAVSGSSAGPTAAIGGPCFISRCSGKGLVQWNVQSARTRRQSLRVMSLILLMNFQPFFAGTMLMSDKDVATIC